MQLNLFQLLLLKGLWKGTVAGASYNTLMFNADNGCENKIFFAFS